MLNPKSISPLAAAAAAACVLAVAGTAQAIPFNFNVTGGCSEDCMANATITPGAGTLTVVLRDTQANPRSAGDLLSSIEISLAGSLGTPSLLSQTGSLITVTSTTGPYATSPGPPTHWGVGIDSTASHCVTAPCIALETAGPFAVGGAPINMIIGPPDGSGNYSNANSSITNGNFSPYINGTGTFVINDSAVTDATTVTGVKFNFGTGPDTFLTGAVCIPGTPNCGSGPPVVPDLAPSPC